MISKILDLAGAEFKSIVKQSLLFLVICGLVLSAAIGVFSFSVNLVPNYATFLNQGVDNGFDFNVYPDDEKMFFKGSAVAGQSYVTAPFITYSTTLHYRDAIYETYGASTEILSGRAYIFKETLPRVFQGVRVVKGTLWSTEDNGKPDGYFNIFLRDTVAECLGIRVGDTLTIWSGSTQYAVKGIYESREGIPAFVMSYQACVSRAGNDIWYYLEADNAEKMINVYPKLRSIGFELGGTMFAEMGLMISARYLLIVLSAMVVFAAFMILNNILSIILYYRHQFIAKLKLLGAETSVVAGLYFSFVTISFVLAYTIAVVLSFVMKLYYENIASALFGFNFVIDIKWYTLVCPFFIGAAILAVRFIRFKKKVSGVRILDFMRDEQ
ncbi:MAG: hypothetical protein LBT20_06310 [Clostridiales bacterium]|jgi:hypothetical protein|nr:hypothetical protein [Clostridiales bacterium]